MKKSPCCKSVYLCLLFAFSISSVLLPWNISAQGGQDFNHPKSSALALCHDRQLSVRHVTEDAAMGGVRVAFFELTNKSTEPCTIKGFPRFEVLNKSGRPIRGGRAAKGITMLDEEAKAPPSEVTIEPGKTATFIIYYNAGGAGYMGKPCPTYRKVRITAPGTKLGVVLRKEIQLCGSLEVSPVRPPSEHGSQ